MFIFVDNINLDNEIVTLKLFKKKIMEAIM